jgi:hypothetical protein
VLKEKKKKETPEKQKQLSTIYPVSVKLSFRSEREIKAFPHTLN